MFSPDAFKPWHEQTSPTGLLADFWKDLAIQFQLQAILIVRFDAENSDIEVVSTYGAPAEPFNGAEKRWLIEALNDCFKKFSAPHVHNIGHLALANVIKRFSQKLTGTNRLWFIPTTAYGMRFIFLGFPKADWRGREIPPTLSADLDRAFFVQARVMLTALTAERLRVTELFVKEMGHDVSSSVQAIIAKAQTISDGRVSGGAAKKKAGEIEKEILNVHRVAEFLGTAVDPNYQIQNADDYELSDCIKRAIDHFSSEADEKRIRIRYTAPNGPMPMWGDKNAIEQAIGQLLLNAIKYAHGQTEVDIAVIDEGDSAVVKVVNQGIALPGGAELHSIWDFGYRGHEAKERHVNGSGIGLYTARKIATAHAGVTSAERIGRETVFRLFLPKRDKVRFRLSRL
jgi:signal transduction histidine kinase